MNGPFQIRTYGKGELAQLYAPYVTQAAACKKLMYWISLQPQLVELRVHRQSLWCTFRWWYR